MSKSMLVNVTAEEEHRVAVVDNGVLDLFEIETLSHEHLKGNIFKATVEGVNTALEAAFVNYGGERAGFLPVDELNFKVYPSRNGGSGGKGRGSRIARHLEKGMDVLVQVIRDSYATKPPTLSTYYSLPGRYLVLMPGADAAGISRKIEDEEQRGRLRKILADLDVPEGYGVIVRTAGTEITSLELQADLDALMELWKTIENASQQVKAPALIYQERDLVIRTTRDYFTSDIEEILIDDPPTHQRVKKFFDVHMPDRSHLVKLYTGDKPIFHKHNLEEQIERIFKRTVQLKSGGSISVDQTEALTAIDVNSARSTRSSSSEDTATRTNLEAADEIARQLRLRDIGGLIVIDFIDMESSRHSRQVERAFAEAMSRDKARYDATRISKLGLMEVSRQRLKASKTSSSFKECPSCRGDGLIRTPEAAARSAFRKIQWRAAGGELSGVKVYLPTEVALYLLNEKRDDLYRLEDRHKVHIEVAPQEEMRADQFEIEEIHREEEAVAPIVTADSVDEVLAAGSRSSERRRPEPRKVAQAEEAGAEKPKKSRRRRGRRRGKGSETDTTPQIAASPDKEMEMAAAAGDGDSAVFSEGPDTESEQPTKAAGEPRSAGDEIQSSEGADAVTEQTRRPPRRRRRRRRSRDGRDGQGRAPRRIDSVSEPASFEARAAGPRPAYGSGRERSPSEPAELAAPPPYAVPRAVAPPERAAPPQAEATLPPAGATPAAAEEAPKPKRRWWRRAFKG